MKKTAIIFLLSILIFTAYLWFDHHNQPAPGWRQAPPEERLVTIKPGSSLQDIAHLLEKEGVTRSGYIFMAYAFLQNKQGALQAGTYRFDREPEIDEILYKINNGIVANERVTVPEGFTVEEIAERVSENLPIESEEFLQALENSDWELDYLPDADKVEWKLEGYLYPTTYNVNYDIEPEKLIELMLNRFEQQWLEELKNNFQADNENFSINELVTIASMVEKEGRLKEEKPVIAGVIFNRLRAGMKLQIDASVQYALPERQERLFYRDLEIESNYNTYLHHGLPPGPIANPGDDSLQAVLEPEDTDYLFYFALEDGSHVFTETYQEHLQKQRNLLD